MRRDLVYKKKSFVNWCGTCRTVLANEQVEGGACWRCGSEVTQKELDQWFFRITRYAEELLDCCDRLPAGPSGSSPCRRTGSGRASGPRYDFPIEGREQSITVFTTRPDTLFGATFMSLAPENPLALQLSRRTQRRQQAVQAFVERVIRTG